MSSKLVKKLLQQTTVPLANNEHYDGDTQQWTRKRNNKAVSISSESKVSKEDMVQEHVQSLLRLDNLVQRYSSSTAQKSFDRQTSNLKKRQKQNDLKRNAGSSGGISNSRSSSSSFALKPHERRFDKEGEKRRREEGYYEDLARALKKANKSKKRKK